MSGSAEQRTTQVNLDPVIDADGNFETGVRRIIVSLDQLDAKWRQVTQQSGTFEREIKQATGSIQPLSDSVNRMFGTSGIQAYTEQVYKLAVAYNNRDLQGGAGALFATLDRFNKMLPDVMQKYRFTNAEIEKLVLELPKLAEGWKAQAAASGATNEKLGQTTQLLAAQALAQERITNARARDTLALREQSQALAAEQRSAIQGTIAGATGTGRGTVSIQGTSVQREIEAAFTEGLARRAAQAQSLVDKYDKLGAQTKALEADEQKLNQAMRLGDITAAQFALSIGKIVEERRKLEAQNASTASKFAGIGGDIGSNLRDVQARETAQQTEALVASYNKVGQSIEALRVKQELLQNAWRQPGLSMVEVANAAKGLDAELQKMSDEYYGVTAAQEAFNREAKQNETALERLRSQYDRAGTALQALQRDQQELNRLLLSSNSALQLPEYMQLTAQNRLQQAALSARASNVPSRLQGADIGIMLNKADADATAASVQRLATTYDTLNTSIDRLKSDLAELNKLFAAGEVSPQAYARQVQNLTASLNQLENGTVKVGNAYQRQQILQAGLVNTFQSLAAGAGVMQTLFIQSTQLVGAFGNINMSLLAMATGVLVVVGAFASLGSSIAKVGDQAVMAQARIAALTGSARQAVEAYDALRLIGQSTGVSANTSANAFSRLTLGTEALGATQQQVLDLTRMFQQLGIIGGGTTQEITAGMIQFTQAMSKGKLDGDELRSIMENLPLVTRSLSRELGVTVGQLRDMGERGQLTSRVVFDAMLRQANDVNQQFQQLPVTMERGWNQVKVAIEAALVDLDRFLNLSVRIGGAFAAAAGYINEIRLGLGGGTPAETIASLQTERSTIQGRLNRFSVGPTIAVPSMALPDPGGSAFSSAEWWANISRMGLPAWATSGRVISPEERAWGIEYPASRRQADLARLREVERLLSAGPLGNIVGLALDNASSRVTGLNAPNPEAQAINREIENRLSSNNTREGIEYNYTRRVARTNIAITQNRADVAAASAAVNNARYEGNPETLAAANDRLKTANEALSRSERDLTDAQTDRDRALRNLTASSDAAARREENRIERLREAVRRTTESLADSGASREVRAYGELAEKLGLVARDRNLAAQNTQDLTAANNALNRSLEDQAKKFDESNRALERQVQDINDKNRIQQLENVGTRGAMAEIDRLTKQRETERNEIERANSLLTVTNGLRSVETQLARARRAAGENADGDQEVQLLQQQLDLLTRQRDTINDIYNRRSDAINDPNNGRLAQSIAQDTRTATERATKYAGDFFYDYMTGKVSSIGDTLKQTLQRAVADGLANAVVKPLIQPIIGTIVSAGSSMLGGASNAFSSGLSWLGSQLGLGNVMPVASTAGSWAAASQELQKTGTMSMAGRFGNLGAAFTGQGLSNTGFGFVDSFLNTPVFGAGGLTGSATMVMGPNGLVPMVNMQNVNGTLTAAPMMNNVGVNGLTTAGAIGGGLSVLGGAYSLYSGIQRGGVGGAVGAVGGLAGMAGGAATIAGGIGAASAAAGGTGLLATMAPALTAAGPYGMIAAAILAVVSALLPGQKASGKGQETRISLDTGDKAYYGLGGSRFSAANREQSDTAASSIVALAKQLSDLTKTRIGGEVAIGVTSSRGDGPGTLYLDINGKKGQYANSEEGAQDLANQAAQYLLEAFRDAASGDMKNILKNSGNVEALGENLEFYNNTYLKFGETEAKTSAFQQSLDSLNDSFDQVAEKANSLGLELTNIDRERDKQVAKLYQQRDLEVRNIDTTLSWRSAQAKGTGYDYNSMLVSFRANQQTSWEQEIEALRKQLEDLGKSAEETASRVSKLKEIQSAEYWKQVGDFMTGLDQNNTLRNLQSADKQREAELFQFDIQAQQELKTLKESLLGLGINADWAAKKITETESSLGNARLALLKRQQDQLIEERKQKNAANDNYVTGINDWLSGHMFSQTSSLGVQAQLEEARRQYNAVFSNPDNRDAGKLTNAADQLLTLLQQVYGRGSSEYANQDYLIKSQLTQLGLSLSTVDTDKEVVANLKELVEVTKQQNKLLQSLIQETRDKNNASIAA